MQNYNYAAIRKLVEAALDDEDLQIFCYDHFSNVAEQFTTGQTKRARVQMLIDYVRRHGLADRLLGEIRAENPYQYKIFENGLREDGPTAQKGPVLPLRSESLTISVKEARKVFKLNDKWLPQQYIINDFRNNGDGTITDCSTGLMWQQSGSDTYMKYGKVLDYVGRLNRERFADYNNWRLPTVEELISLIEPEKKSDNLFIDPLFDRHQERCWSLDRRSSGGTWIVSFPHGSVSWRSVADWLIPGPHPFVRLVRTCSGYDELKPDNARWGNNNDPEVYYSGELKTGNTQPTGPSGSTDVQVMISFELKTKLVDALLSCASMSDRDSRNAVVNELRSEIKSSISRNNADRIDVVNIVSRCLDFHNGINELVSILRTFEGGSIGMQNVERVMDEYV